MFHFKTNIYCCLDSHANAKIKLQYRVLPEILPSTPKKKTILDITLVETLAKVA